MSPGEVNKYYYYNEGSEGILQEYVLTLGEVAYIHNDESISFLDFFVRFGGFLYALGVVGTVFVKVFKPDLVTSNLVTSLFRKPEVYKFAKVEVVDYQPVLEGRMTKEEYERL